jgi:hypothetical protein
MTRLLNCDGRMYFVNGIVILLLICISVFPFL